MAMTMFGTQAPQKLFQDIPASAANVPGMVTPNITAAMPSYADLSGILDAQNKQKELRNAAWARADATRAAQQRQQQQAGEQDKMRSAFNEVYGPQLQSASHDAAFGDPGQRGKQLRRQYGNMPGGPWMSGQSWQEGKVPFQGIGGTNLQEALDNMWRQQTDPYLRAVSGGTANPSDLIRMMHPGGSVGGSNPAAWARMVREHSGGGQEE